MRYTVWDFINDVQAKPGWTAAVNSDGSLTISKHGQVVYACVRWNIMPPYHTKIVDGVVVRVIVRNASDDDDDDTVTVLFSDGNVGVTDADTFLGNLK